MDDSFLNKSIASTPGAAKFRSTVVVIFTVICIAVFLTFTANLSDKAKDIAKNRVLTDIRYSLSTMLYDYTIKGQQDKLKKFHLKNPFVPLDIYRSSPPNYSGTSVSQKVKSNQWFYDIKEQKLGYKNEDNVSYWQMVYVKENGLGYLKLIQR